VLHSRVGSLPYSQTLYQDEKPVLRSRVGYQPYPQMLDLAGKPAKDLHSSLLQKLVTYGLKNFYHIGPWAQCHETFYLRNLRIF
jgi:hypothetical protein